MEPEKMQNKLAASPTARKHRQREAMMSLRLWLEISSHTTLLRS
jgi:hypothetical protein